MPKLQWTAPASLSEIVDHVQVKTNAKGIAIEYLLYLARQMPHFPKKNYPGEKTENCTLGMDTKVYAADFDDYRQQQRPPLATQKAFFEDALTRGAAMYEFGYRLSDPRKPSSSHLQVSSEWLDLADRLGAVADCLREPTGDFEMYRKARKQAQSSMPIGLLLIRVLKAPGLRAEVEAFTAAFSSAGEQRKKEEIAVAILAAVKAADESSLFFERWDDLQAIPAADTGKVVR